MRPRPSCWLPVPGLHHGRSQLSRARDWQGCHGAKLKSWVLQPLLRDPDTPLNCPVPQCPHGQNRARCTEQGHLGRNQQGSGRGRLEDNCGLWDHSSPSWRGAQGLREDCVGRTLGCTGPSAGDRAGDGSADSLPREKPGGGFPCCEPLHSRLWASHARSRPPGETCTSSRLRVQRAVCGQGQAHAAQGPLCTALSPHPPASPVPEPGGREPDGDRNPDSGWHHLGPAR